MTEDRYVHGSDPGEQDRLSALNALLNARSLERMELQTGQRVLDLGSGLGQFTRMMAGVAGAGHVVGVERDPRQLARCHELASAAGEGDAVEFRRGSVDATPLSDEEWGSFDVVHARFLLEHLRDPQRAVDTMVRAVRPGGRIIIEDDDHDLLRLWPAVPEIEGVWRGYVESYRHNGCDPFIGRRLADMCARAGAVPERIDWPFFGACHGMPTFSTYVENMARILEGARDDIHAASGIVPEDTDAAARMLREWGTRSGASLWYCTFWVMARTRR